MAIKTKKTKPSSLHEPFCSPLSMFASTFSDNRVTFHELIRWTISHEMVMKTQNKKKNAVCEMKLLPFTAVFTAALQLIMLNVNEYSLHFHPDQIIPPLSPGLFFFFFFSNFVPECLLPVNKQENRPCHVSLGLPHSSLICENMYSGQRFSGLPSRPCQSSVFLSANMQTNTCTKGHTMPSKYCML